MNWFRLRPRPTRTHQPWEPTREEQVPDPTTGDLPPTRYTTHPLRGQSSTTEPVTPHRGIHALPPQGTTTSVHHGAISIPDVQQEAFTSGPFMVPDNLTEINRLDFQHYALRQCMRGNYTAPITRVRSILDVGTGTGRWCWEMCQQFPQVSVVGLDIRLPPQSATRPPNYIFVRGNILETLPFANESFDFVHQRLILFRLPANKLQHVFLELFRVTARSGWIEVLEVEPEFQNGGPACKVLNDWAGKASLQHGIDLYQGRRVGEFLHLLGLKHIETRTITLPIGRWAGRVGSLMAADMAALNRGIRQQMITELHVRPEEYDRLSQQMQQEWEDRRCAMVFHVAYGQRS